METLSANKTQSWLSWFLKGLLILGFFILLGRLIELQIIRGNYYKNLSEGNRIRRVTISAPRGQILARGGEILVGNKVVKRKIVFNPESGYEKLDADAHGAEFTEMTRDYVLGQEAGHISGYLGEVSPDELGKIKGECPSKGPRKLGFLIGRSGLEELYDCHLSGFDGEELIEVDSQSMKVRTLGIKEPIPGNDLKTTIHYGLQKKLAQILGEKKGAVVVTGSFGEVLALFSSPSYDPNIFVNEIDFNKVEKILTNPNLPLFNRAIGGMFHPGSVFKPIVSIAALEEGKVDEDFLFEDRGNITIQSPYGNFTYSNWYFTQYGGVEGNIDLPRAIARSTDTFFYKVGELLGIEAIVTWAEKFGLGQKTGIDLPGEIAGLVPSPDWKLKVKGERWFLGNTYHISIGQGDLAVSPIALNRGIEAIASGGILCRPHLSLAVESGNDKCRNLNIGKANIDLVKKGMVAACSPGGTGFTFFEFKEKNKVEVACKTGTAQTESGEPHAWFTAFGPADNPEIILTVLVENGGEGSKVAGPIAREIFDYWFEGREND